MQKKARVVVFVQGWHNELRFVHVCGRNHHPDKDKSADVRHLPGEKFVFSLCHFWPPVLFMQDNSRSMLSQCTIGTSAQLLLAVREEIKEKAKTALACFDGVEKTLLVVQLVHSICSSSKSSKAYKTQINISHHLQSTSLSRSCHFEAKKLLKFSNASLKNVEWIWGIICYLFKTRFLLWSLDFALWSQFQSD